MSVIDNLIYDRTAADVQRVHDFRNRILAGGLNALTASERAEYLTGMKGAYNATDLNRVGEAVQYLADRMVSLSSDVASLREGGNVLDLENRTRTYVTVEGEADDFVLTSTTSSTCYMQYVLPDDVSGKTFYFSGTLVRNGTFASGLAVRLSYVTDTSHVNTIPNTNFVNNVSANTDVPVEIPANATSIRFRLIVSTGSDPIGNTVRAYNLRLRPVAGWTDVAESAATSMPYDPSEITVTAKQDWTMTDVPTQAQAATYIADLNMIRKQLPLPSNTPVVPASLDYLDYIAANNIERVLYVVDQRLTIAYNTAVANINAVSLSEEYTGEAICGTN